LQKVYRDTVTFFFGNIWRPQRPIPLHLSRLALVRSSHRRDFVQRFPLSPPPFSGWTLSAFSLYGVLTIWRPLFLPFSSACALSTTPQPSPLSTSFSPLPLLHWRTAGPTHMPLLTRDFSPFPSPFFFKPPPLLL